jgi:hypothetical protein
MLNRKLFLTVFAFFFAFSALGVVRGQQKSKTRKPAETHAAPTMTEAPPVIPETILGADDNAALAIMYSGEMRGNLSTCG